MVGEESFKDEEGGGRRGGNIKKILNYYFLFSIVCLFFLSLPLRKLKKN